MSFRKLNLYRNRIDDVVRSFVPGDAIVKREEVSFQKIKYIVTFADQKEQPAMLFVNYNKDGTTTLEDCRGQNKVFSAKLAEHVVKTTQAILYETENLYFKSISDEQFKMFSEYMTDCNATMATTEVPNGNKYTFSGEYGDTIYATRYNNGSIFFQGHPSITFNNAISILADIYPSDVILVGLTKYYKIDFEKADLEKEFLSICPNLAEKLPADVVNIILPTIGLRRAVPGGLTDYSYLCFPLLRGLEGLIRCIFKDKGVVLTAKDHFGGYLKYNETTLTASVETRHLGLFPDASEKTRVETLYALLNQQRHRIFHVDPLMPLIISKEDALDIVEQSLKTINNVY